MGNGLLRGVRQRQCDMDSSELRCKFGRLAVENDSWPSSGFAVDFDVAPTDAVVPAGAKRFHRRFFGRKARGIAFIAVRLGVAVAHLLFRKDSSQKAISKAGDGLG